MPDQGIPLGQCLMAFKGQSTEAPVPPNPEALYRDLPRRPGAVPGLWSRQVDLMRIYATDHQETADLALELPTGTGKTLPGLLLADWNRRKRHKRVAYACPTHQLALQVFATTISKSGSLRSGFERSQR